MIVLASGSPRRKELLTQMGYDYIIRTSNTEEVPTATVPSEIVKELSLQKGEDVFNTLKKEGGIDDNGTLIIAADTLVFLGDERLGKPHTREVAKEMIEKLAGKVHQVLTGVSLIYVKNGNVKKCSFYESTDVSVYEMSEAEIDSYVSTDEPLDKAGAYAIQGFFGKYIKEIKGEYANVVGLPVGRLYHEMCKIMED